MKTAMATAEPLTTPDLTSLAQDAHSAPRSQSPTRNTRHGKGISLNFPILVPSHQPSRSSSPRATSPVNGFSRSSPQTKADPFLASNPPPSPSRTGAEILTLVAAQERRVLELREELARAESELNIFKKQWAIYEANKKREEVRHVRKMPVSLDEVPSPKRLNEDEVEEERRRRRALLEMSNNATHQASSSDSGKLGRKGSQRVFEGGHTRALSLLSPTSQKHTQGMPGNSIDELLKMDGETNSEDASAEQTPKPSLPRTHTLDVLMFPASLEDSFGRTYKDLAAHQKSLPPVSTDVFMKSSKQVVDGVREGLWNFFEDIRQATIGDEAINGPNAQRGHRRPSRDPTKPTRQKSRSSKPAMHNNSEQKEPSFWNEFGLDTPGKRRASPPEDSRNGHEQQKGSASLRDQPGVLADTNANDDDWDNWESPINAKTNANNNCAHSQAAESLPWPELKKLTPSKLNRTASDMMRQWRDESDQQMPHTQDAATS